MIKTILRRVLFGWLILIFWPIIYFFEWLLNVKDTSYNEFARFIWYGWEGQKNG
jgi:hypothetical protein